MAEKAVAKVETRPFSATYKWEALANGDTGEALEQPFPSLCMQVLGTFGTGGSVKLQGSNDGGTTWADLNDLDGTAIAVTAAGMVQVRERPLAVRPNVTAGDGTTALDVHIHGTE